jgi:ribosome-associated heat shock protein Hsp15
MTRELQPSSGPRQRIDKWLFFARMSKSRSIAQSQIQSGKLRINGSPVTQPSFLVKAGDRIDLSLERRNLVLIVKLAGTRRGPFDEAKLLYDDLTPTAEEVKKLTPYEQAVREPGSGRPTKRDRRALDRLLPDDLWDKD